MLKYIFSRPRMHPSNGCEWDKLEENLGMRQLPGIATTDFLWFSHN